MKDSVTTNHEWFYSDFVMKECCKKCGYVRNASSDDRPCKGPVKVGLR